jgi:hypothetical protein
VNNDAPTSVTFVSNVNPFSCNLALYVHKANSVVVVLVSCSLKSVKCRFDNNNTKQKKTTQEEEEEALEMKGFSAVVSGTVHLH